MSHRSPTGFAFSMIFEIAAVVIIVSLLPRFDLRPVATAQAASGESRGIVPSLASQIDGCRHAFRFARELTRQFKRVEQAPRECRAKPVHVHGVVHPGSDVGPISHDGAGAVTLIRMRAVVGKTIVRLNSEWGATGVNSSASTAGSTSGPPAEKL